MQKNFPLELPVLHFSNKPDEVWKLRNAFEGVQIFGSIGSGKTSGSGRTIALKYLEMGFGGLVLTVKQDETRLWKEYCLEAGRSHDLLIIGEGSSHKFNFLEYESTVTETNQSLTENIVEVLRTVIRASKEKEGGEDSAFWENALDMLMFNVIDLCKMAYGKLTVQLLSDIALSAPKPVEGKNQTSENSDEQTGFEKAYHIVHHRIKTALYDWYNSLTEDYKASLNQESYQEAYFAVIPEARLFASISFFFNDTFKNLNEKTRSIVDLMFSGFLFRLLRDPLYSTFCNGTSTVTPEDSLKGKIILINFPVKVYHKIGRDCQVLFKYIWQRRMEKRNTFTDNRPVFLWADEAQNFIHEHDADYQATARSSMISTVYLTQNLPNYYASMGGERGANKVKSFIGTLGTKIFHANSDIDTNEYASQLVGDQFVVDGSTNQNLGKELSFGKSQSTILERVIRPEQFVGFINGGQQNDNKVKGLVHVQGTPLFNGKNYKVITFLQG